MTHRNGFSQYALIALTTINFFAHSAQSKETIDTIFNEMDQALEVYDVKKVREALQTGIYSHELDPDSCQNPVKLISDLLRETYKAPEEGKEGWHQRYNTILDLLFSETQLPVNKVINHYNRDETLRSSYTLLQICLCEHWRHELILHKMPHQGVPRMDIAKELVRKGARLHPKNGFNSSVLHCLAEYFTMSYPIGHPGCIQTIVENLKSAYPQPAPTDQAPSAFADDIRKVDFTSGIFTPLTTKDGSILKSNLMKLKVDDIKYLRSLHALQQETKQYYLNRAQGLLPNHMRPK